ncbi:hypothetical protein K9N68_38635 (plasmid) [Kovacikia minuta CCNUW1]|uniref:hypothetical protein n=1 Tax=Kovacikia minuta TaxID=2931930 RepID=UPI001CCA863A|nr:hypothetical protein [Kovacikia minuta]UBF30101.1 hypothetical protein K9N68_38635 [Kovacikia minuta CCNUW1]
MFQRFRLLEEKLLKFFMISIVLFMGCGHALLKQPNVKTSETEDSLNKKIQEAPDNPFPYLERADIRTRVGNGGGAILDYTKVIDLVSSNEKKFSGINLAGVFSSRGQEYHIIADLYKDDKKFAQAKIYYELALKDLQKVLIFCRYDKCKTEYQLALQDIKDITKKLAAISK